MILALYILWSVVIIEFICAIVKMIYKLIK